MTLYSTYRIFVRNSRPEENIILHTSHVRQPLLVAWKLDANFGPPQCCIFLEHCFVIDFETFVSTGAGCQSLPTNNSNDYGVVFRDTLFIGFLFFKV